MIVDKDKIKSLHNFIDFHRPVHKKLPILLLEKIAYEIDFKMKVQKASIQLICSQPFAVIGLRQNQEHIFVEFYSEIKIDKARIVNITKGKSELLINRINLIKECEIDLELIKYILHSNELLN